MLKIKNLDLFPVLKEFCKWIIKFWSSYLMNLVASFLEYAV